MLPKKKSKKALAPPPPLPVVRQSRLKAYALLVISYAAPPPLPTYSCYSKVGGGGVVWQCMGVLYDVWELCLMCGGFIMGSVM